MGWAQSESGTQTATIDTEHTLGTDPTLTDGTLVLMVEMVNMAAADVVVIKFYEKITGTGGAQLGMILGTMAGVQTNDLWFSVPVLNLFGAKFTLEQTDGTGRDFDWSIRAIT